MAFGITDLKKGTIFQLDGEPWRVVDYAQKVMGRGGSIVNVKIKSLLDSRVLDKTFKGNEAIAPADVSKSSVQYLYNTGNDYFFMDNDSYNQYELSGEIIGDLSNFLREGDTVQILLFNGQPVSIELPKNVNLKVTYAEDVVKGDTTNSVQKDAEVETGLIVRVPAFIKQGDEISVDTSTGTYRERVKA